MAVIVTREVGTTERIDTRNSEVTVPYFAIATGADKYNETTIRNTVNANTPAFYAGLTKVSIQIQEIGSGINRVEVLYRLEEGEPHTGGLPGVGGPGGEPPSTPTEEQSLDENFSVEISTETEHVTQSRSTVESRQRGGGGIPQNHQRAIGVTMDGKERKVEGCDKLKPVTSWTYVLKAPGISMSYIRFLGRMVGCVNANRFFHHEVGECLLMGVSAQTTGPIGVSYTFKFGVIPNEDGGLYRQGPVPLGGDLPQVVIIDPAEDPEGGLVIPKRGWDYLWVQYETSEVDGRPARVPIAAYTEEIYRYVNMQDLGIGG